MTNGSRDRVTKSPKCGKFVIEMLRRVKSCVPKASESPNPITYITNVTFHDIFNVFLLLSLLLFCRHVAHWKIAIA